MSIAIPGRRALLFTEDYLTTLRRTEPDRIVGLWLGNEASGATAFDRGSGAHHGVYAGVTLGGPGPINGLAAPFYDGSTGYLNVYSESLVVGKGTENLCTNPSFEAGTTGWSVYYNIAGIEKSTAYAYVGTASLGIIGNGSGGGAAQSDYLVVSPNTTYTMQARFLSPFGKSCSLWMEEFNSANVSQKAHGPGATLTPLQWTQQTYTFTTTVSTAKIKIYLYVYTLAANQRVYVDAVQLERLGYATAFEGYPGFLGSEGTALCWARVANADVWTDGATRAVLDIRADDNNAVKLYKSTVNNTLVASYTANAVAKECSVGSLSTTDWFPLALTWSVSAGEVRAYLNGVQQGDTLTGLGSWLGKVAADRSIIGAETKDPLSPWHGWIGPVALWNRALSPAAIARLSRRG